MSQKRPVSALAMCGTGTQIAVASDQTIALYNGEDGKLTGTMFAGRHPIKKLLYSSDCRMVAGWDSGHAIWLWDVESRMTLATVPQQKAPFVMKFSPDGRKLAVQSADGAVRLISTDLDWLHFEKPDDLIDWARGTVSSALSATERQRFLFKDNEDKEADLHLINFVHSSDPANLSDGQRAELLKSAVQTARSQGTAGADGALRALTPAFGGKAANAAMQLATELDTQISSAEDAERAYFYFQLSQRLVRASAPDQIDTALYSKVEQRLRILPRQISPPALVKLFRAARDWSPK